MRPRQIFITCLVLLHLLAVAAFIWTDFGSSPGSLGAALRTYRNVSGIFRDYTFFAPAVGSDYKAAFLLEDAGGGGARLVDFYSDSREINFRYRCLIGAGMRNVDAQDLYARSWAALLLGSDPAAGKVTVMTRMYALPTMAEYRRGRRPEWKTIYAGEFIRRQSGDRK